MKILLLLTLIVSNVAFAETSKELFCKNHKDRATIVKQMSDWHNMLSVGNESGFLGIKTGVCWWHSRFQRNLSYLVQFDPALAKPTKKEAKKLINQIRDGEQIVIIPGFNNSREFSIAYHDEIISTLRGWVNHDFLIKQDWTRAYSGETSMSVGDFQNHMADMKKTFDESDGILFTILKFNTSIAHAWLITEFNKTTDGWNLEIVDSNSSLYKYKVFVSNDATNIIPDSRDPRNQEYYNVASFLFRYTAVPYIYQQPELKRIKKVLQNYCSPL